MTVLSLVGRMLYRLQLACARAEGGREQPWWARVLGVMARRGREIVARRWDPVVRMRVGKHGLDMPLSHQLPLYLHESESYDRVLPRVAKALRATGSVRIIDVGANVGDTAALVADAVADAELLCIEGSARYFPLLEANVQRRAIRAICERSYCGEGDGGIVLSAEEQDGNGRLYTPRSFRPGKGVAREARILSLDTLLLGYPRFRDAELLKTDTEGFDLQVLRGARELLVRTRPVLFVEYHPQLLREAHDDPRGLAPLLTAAGYRHAVAFTNLGRMHSRIDLLQPDAVTELDAQINLREVHYFDLLVAPPEREGLLSAVC